MYVSTSTANPLFGCLNLPIIIVLDVLCISSRSATIKDEK